LGKAEQALLRLDIALGRRIFVREAADFANDVREIARRFPDDPSVAAILTEAEYLVDNRPAARQAVERWLTLKPDDARALSYKGLIEASELAAATRNDKESWASAIKWVTKARAAAPKDPLVLEAFYDVHAARGDLPPARAQNALFQAMKLMPKDSRLRQKVAGDFERRELIEDAIAIIQPLVFGTHHIDRESEKEKLKRERWEEKWRRAGAEKVETPREMLARLEAKLASTRATPAPALEAAATP
jgi:predicted Zn-dependent protease